MKRLCSTILLFSVAVFAVAQDVWRASDIADSLKREAYSVVRDYQATVTASSKKSMTTHYRRVVTILNKKGDDHALWNCTTDDFSQLTSFSGKIYDEQGRVKGDYPQEDFQTMGGEEAFLKSLSWQIHGVYAVRTHLILRFPYDDSAYTYSDDNTTRLHFYHARLVATCEGIYFYRQHAQSVTNAVSLRRFDYLKANASMRRQLLQLGVSRDIIDRYENIRWLNVVDLYMLYYQHRRQFPAADRKEALAMVRQAWQSIQVESLEPRNRWKFGYCPCRPFWLLFRIQEEAYFTLRHLRDRILR